MKEIIVKYLAVGLVLSPLTSVSLVKANGLVDGGFYAQPPVKGMSMGGFMNVHAEQGAIEDEFDVIIGGKLVPDTTHGGVRIQDNPFHEYKSEPDITTGQKVKYGVVRAGKTVVNAYCAIENVADAAYSLYKGLTPELSDEQIAAMTGVQVNQYNKDAASLAYWASWGRWGYRVGAGGLAAARYADRLVDFGHKCVYNVCYGGLTTYAGFDPRSASFAACGIEHVVMGTYGTRTAQAFVWGAAAYAPEIAYHTLKAPRYTYETGKFVVTKPVEAGKYAVETVKAVPGKIGAAATYTVDKAVAAKAKAASVIATVDEKTQPARKAISSAVSSGWSAIKAGWSYLTGK